MWEQVKMKHMLPVWCETTGELLNVERLKKRWKEKGGDMAE